MVSTILFFSCGNTTQQKTEESGSQTAADTTANNEEAAKTILFFGNSLTAGLGLDSPDLSFPGLIQQRIDSLQLPYRVINGGLSGETSSGGNERIDWLLNQQIDIFVLELGANDGLRGIPTKETHQNLQHIIDKVKSTYPACKLVLAGMMVPPSMGSDYGREFNAIFPALAKDNAMALIPFLLEGVAGETTLNQGDGIHPTAAGHQIVADNVWRVLEPLL